MRLAVLTGLYVGVVVSEMVDNSFGAYLRDRIRDAWRVVATNAISVPLVLVLRRYVRAR